jgi:elongation factor P--(R)-beta-lysine ligase
MWRPANTPAARRTRAALLQAIRAFFYTRDVLEVDTPALASHTVTEVNIDAIAIPYHGKTLFLQTSPEYAMKRLLADGETAIFQVAKVFRDGEQGARHNPEFTLLEWYRSGYDHWQLMDEVRALITHICAEVKAAQAPPIETMTYHALFEHYLDINPHHTSVAALQDAVRAQQLPPITSDFVDTYLDYLYAYVVEPQLQNRAVFIVDYPASQAALARLTTRADGEQVAQRFELVINGLEIANGYHELTDASEQGARFAQDNRIRRSIGKPERTADTLFLAALEYGLPACAGVAIGIERLQMALCGEKTLSDTLCFPLDRA